MSTQTADFPDFFAGPQQVNVGPFIAESNVAHVPGYVTYGPYNVTAWDGLLINAISDHRLDGSITFYGDQALTTTVGAVAFKSPAGRGVVDWFPVMGPWMTIKVDYSTGGGNAVSTLTAQMRQGPRNWPGQLTALWNGSVVAQGIAAGSDNTTPLFSTVSGRGTFAVDTDATVWTAKLQMISEGGVVFGPIAKIEHAVAGDACMCSLSFPSYPCQIVLHNGDGVLRTFNALVILDRAG